MTIKEAIEILKPLFDQCKGTDGCLGYIEHYFTKNEEEALDLAIKALKEKMWIPTSKMLPDEQDSYLVMWRERDRKWSDRLFYEITEYHPPKEDEEEGEWEKIEQAGESGAEIIAWMPLPARYEPM